MTRGGIFTAAFYQHPNEVVVGQGSKLTVLAHLQIIRQIDSIGDDIMRPSSKVHVTNRATRKHKTCQHLR